VTFGFRLTRGRVVRQKGAAGDCGKEKGRLDFSQAALLGWRGFVNYVFRLKEPSARAREFAWAAYHL
jgi:hypothetical protein